MQCVRIIDPATGGACPNVRQVRGKLDSADAPLDIPWTDYRRRMLAPFTSSDCCYRWCAPLAVHAAEDMRGQELTCDKLFPRGEECFDLLSGPSRFPVSPQYPECAAGLHSVGAGFPGAHGYAVFSASTTASYRSEGRRNACCYAFCQTVPGVSFD
jgi:hypothetical protein